MQSTLQFYGGTGTVTGSNFLLRSNPDQSGGTEVNILVDCGLTQGKHTAELDNWAAFPYEPASVQYLVVTHAHIDHIGRIPKLVKDGFRGKIISTKATMSLVEPLLLDSMELLAHDARKHGRLPLYDTGDITNAMGLWEGIGYHQKVALPGNFVLEF
ncbi:MAG TPA: MBL fold metallo-hydrolase, partial [Candidatus Paceibacterota bacterium]|nr:MBL fold metallo-hydrolase [Candidatus Paceibacterota bacterium]